MYRLFLATAIVVLAGSIWMPGANAGCACACYDGRMLATCSNSFDIPPICPAATCSRPSVTPSPPVATGSSCRDEQVCDKFDRCHWKNSCDDRKPDDPLSNNPLTNNR